MSVNDGIDGSYDYFEFDKICKQEYIVSRQRKRLYHRLSTAFYYNRHRTIRFVTLTSSPTSGEMKKDFKKLYERLRRACPIDFIDYLSGNDLFKYKKMLEPLKFEYLAVFTSEGFGVVHLIYVGDYIPFKYLQDLWITCHGAYGVNIKMVKDVYNASGLAGYVLSQYCRGQDALKTYRYSKPFLPVGYDHVWKRIKRDNKGRSLDYKLYLFHSWIDTKHQQHIS